MINMKKIFWQISALSIVLALSLCSLPVAAATSTLTVLTPPLELPVRRNPAAILAGIIQIGVGTLLILSIVSVAASLILYLMYRKKPEKLVKAKRFFVSGYYLGVFVLSMLGFAALGMNDCRHDFTAPTAVFIPVMILLNLLIVIYGASNRNDATKKELAHSCVKIGIVGLLLVLTSFLIPLFTSVTFPDTSCTTVPASGYLGNE